MEVGRPFHIMRKRKSGELPLPVIPPKTRGRRAGKYSCKPPTHYSYPESNLRRDVKDKGKGQIFTIQAIRV